MSQAKQDIAGNTTAIGNANRELATAKSDLTQAKQDIANNTTAIGNANKQITSNKTAIDNANRELDAAQGDIAQAKKDITQAKSDAANAKNEAGKASAAIESAKSDIANAASKAQSALDKANSVGKSLDGLHNVYEGPDDPTTLSGVTVRQGDFWYKTQKYWTRWSGAANDSTSLLADFYTGWSGEPNNSTSWLVPLSSRFIGVYVWDGTAWNERNIVAANILASGSVVASNMAANSITTEKLVAGAITTDKVAANAIVAGKIASGAITTDKLAALAVTADKLAANSVVAGKLAANSVDAGNIVAGAVTVDKLAANSVDASKIVAGAISTDKLAALAVTADKLAANSVVAGKLAANSVNAGNIVSGAITTEKLAALAVTVDKLAADSVDASKIVAQSVTGDRIASNTIVARNIAAQSITSDRIAAGQFAGYVFTGSIFRTSGSNPKVEMTSSGIHVTNSSGQDVLRIGYGVETGLSVMNPYNSKEMVPLTYQAFSQMAYKEQTKQYKTYIKRFDSFDNYESKQDYDNIINLNFVTTKSGKVLIDFETFYSLFVDAILDNRSSPAASVTITAYADYYVKIMNKSGAIKFDDGFLFKNTTVMAFAYKPKSNSAVGNESYRRVVNLDPFQLYSLEVYGSIRFKLSAANNPVFPPRTSDFENYCSGNINGTSISVTPLADS